MAIFLFGSIAAGLGKWVLDYTSSNTFCASCHVHPQATRSWKQGAHYDNESGIFVDCVQCHLPPGGASYLIAKISTGVRDVAAMLFSDTQKINWEARSKREYAARHVYKAACLRCHRNLFPRGLSAKGEKAHLHYEQKAASLRCINCHLETGHFHQKPAVTRAAPAAGDAAPALFDTPAVVRAFRSFTEKIPGTTVSFEMIALPGGEFRLGSPPSETYRQQDEGPQRQVRLSPFWMAKTEVTWDEYEAFIRQTAGEGRTEDQVRAGEQVSAVDGITGPTPPYGDPGQGWGRGGLPAITMTYYAARKYCEWLSRVTGKHYRLPTEAEWEYACRAGTAGAYFFAGDPANFQQHRWLNQIFGADTAGINTYVQFLGNSGGKTHPPAAVQPNPFGLVHMLGNVWEFCADWYAPDSYRRYPEASAVLDPAGPDSGVGRVIRGGSYKSDAAEVRAANRDFTRRTRWQMTDPQIPKSLWWYSDNSDVGFRVVCEPDSGFLHGK